MEKDYMENDLIDIIPYGINDSEIGLEVKCINMEKSFLEKGIEGCWIENYTRSLRYFLSKEIMCLTKKDIVLDIGGGDDGFAYVIEKDVRKVYVNDINIHRCYGSRCGVIESNIFDLNIGKLNVNKIFLGHSFEHFKKNGDIELIKKIGKELPRGGMCCIEPIFIGGEYLEIFSEDTKESSYDKKAKQIVTKISHFPGKKSENMGFARIYSAKSFEERVYNIAKEMGLKINIYSFKSQDEYLPDMKRYKFKRKKINYPYRMLVFEKS